MGSKYIQIFATAGSKKEAEKIANFLIKERFAACAQIIGPVESAYKWKEKIEKQKEWLCLIKTKSDKYKKVEEAIKSIHSYELPEIIATPIEKGSKEYLNWINKQL